MLNLEGKTKEDLMKKAFVISIAAFCLAFLVGCASTYYQVVTNEGKAFVTNEEPEFNQTTQSYEFTDVKGTKWFIKREEIKSMEMKVKGKD